MMIANLVALIQETIKALRDNGLYEPADLIEQKFRKIVNNG